MSRKLIFAQPPLCQVPGGAKQRETQSAEQVTADASLWRRAGERGVGKRYRPGQYSGRAVQRPDRGRGQLDPGRYAQRKKCARKYKVLTRVSPLFRRTALYSVDT